MSLAAFDLAYLKQVPAVVGIDEAGRGPLAGPVCAAAVYLDRAFYESDWFHKYADLVNDSKQLKESTREAIYSAIQSTSGIHWACRMIMVEDIEALNILGATRKAMALCVRDLLEDSACPFEAIYEGEDWLLSQGDQDKMAQLLVDGKPLKPFAYSHTALVKGDAKSLAIALASVIAKVTRDQYMIEKSSVYPDYGFESNKGYGTAAHLRVLKDKGPCPIHRHSFLKNILKT